MKMKTMFGKPLSGLVLISAIAISSCEKNDVDESGTANLKIVNASQSSGPVVTA